MIEIWDLYDANKHLTHQQHKSGYKDRIPEGMFHLVVEIWVIHNGNLYNQYIQVEDLVLQPQEVVNAKYVSFDEMQGMYDKNEIVESVWERFSQFKDKLLQ